jgi:hypothetical protein
METELKTIQLRRVFHSSHLISVQLIRTRTIYSRVMTIGVLLCVIVQ